MSERQETTRHGPRRETDAQAYDRLLSMGKAAAACCGIPPCLQEDCVIEFVEWVFADESRRSYADGLLFRCAVCRKRDSLRRHAAAHRLEAPLSEGVPADERSSPEALLLREEASDELAGALSELTAGAATPRPLQGGWHENKGNRAANP